MQIEKGSTKDREIFLSRMLKAPVELVWEVWTTPDHIASWGGPNEFTNTITIMDVTPGGRWDLIMHGPDGTDYRNKSVLREIIRRRKIVYDYISHPKFTTTVEFEGRGEQTLLNWHALFETAEEFRQVIRTFKADEGLKQNVDKLIVYLNGLNGKRNT
jgi:uncharacterized protein YndB with AHSA1/START domain